MFTAHKEKAFLLDSNDNEEMADAVNTGQLIYCSELMVAHQTKFTELKSECTEKSSTPWPQLKT